MVRYKSSKQTTRAHQQQHSYHAPAPLAAAAGNALTALCATLDSESESCSSSDNDDNSARESIRLRVHNRIMQRVQELHDAYNGHEDHYQPPAAHQAGKQRARTSNNKTPAPVSEPGADDLELLRQDVISVAAQILEWRLHHEAHHHLQHLQQKRALEPESAPSSSSSSTSSSFELHLVHRMLAKESELLALQTRRSHSGHNVRTASTDRGRISNC